MFMCVPSTVKKNKDLLLFRQFSPGVFFFPRRKKKSDSIGQKMMSLKRAKLEVAG